MAQLTSWRIRVSGRMLLPTTRTRWYKSTPPRYSRIATHTQIFQNTNCKRWCLRIHVDLDLWMSQRNFYVEGSPGNIFNNSNTENKNRQHKIRLLIMRANLSMFCFIQLLLWSENNIRQALLAYHTGTLSCSQVYATWNWSSYELLEWCDIYVRMHCSYSYHQH